VSLRNMAAGRAAQHSLEYEMQPTFVWIAALLAVAVIALAIWARSAFRRRPLPSDQPPAPEPLPPTAEGPRATGPQLYLHGVRTRAVIIVVAPVGRGSKLPPVEELPRLLDQAAPGLARVLTPHGARIKLWPPQLSVHGFAQAFFAHFPLPGDRGRGTPWCAVAGKFEASGRPLLLGMVLAASAPNSLSQTIVQQPEEWLRLLEVKEPT
jgi:hypothetical protein